MLSTPTVLRFIDPFLTGRFNKLKRFSTRRSIFYPFLQGLTGCHVKHKNNNTKIS